jgi:transposase
MDFGALAADIALEAQLALELTAHIDKLEERISVFYKQADPQQILMTVPGVGPVLAAQIIGRGRVPSRGVNPEARLPWSEGKQGGMTDCHS